MKERAPKNRTIVLSDNDRKRLLKRLVRFDGSTLLKIPPNSTIPGDCYKVAAHLPHRFVDLLILDPPYNLNKSFNGKLFKRQPVKKYTDYLRNMLAILLPCLKQTASVYICGDWQSSPSIFAAASEKLIVRNRITWEREKGRGAALNWKNASEDIWFCTVSNKYTFNADAVRLRRKVLAPYRSAQGLPKDWQQTKSGNFRDTRASNIWTDITVPFWSMPENTDHPTQKSEKLIAKLILASSKPGDLILDPFLGSGTTSVAAKKLGRRYIGIEIERDYCLLTAKRLEGVKTEANIQGFKDRIFWERNTFAEQLSRPKSEL